ncbi:Uncharacterised protein [Mycobacteroides abscessus subsp. abscessus]|uniref:hypothetical protein n=1 Tax=Mycobacteroides abscessus TaxID=36809 RepID=UPI00092744EE|nr:hypothetical protein [Mycobacteroides abscessus]SIK10256.1 Uncharacterised protein [Mycobacteroides abscessus subsp. abscessus]SKF14659.1 Uncharacterised protein [Mycobacteroides abscessus subsp. abscessus]
MGEEHCAGNTAAQLDGARITDGPIGAGARSALDAYAQRRPYVLVDDLLALHGPKDSVVELPLRLDWSPKRRYDLADDGDRRALYERTLNQATGVEDLTALLNTDLLIELWPRLWLPQQLRDLWQGRFPQLAPQRS